jgi:hypothetical protein
VAGCFTHARSKAFITSLVVQVVDAGAKNVCLNHPKHLLMMWGLSIVVLGFHVLVCCLAALWLEVFTWCHMVCHVYAISHRNPGTDS